MLANALAQATVPAENIDRAIRFYGETLGLKRVEGPPEGAAVFEAGQGSSILIYERPRTKADHTAITFTVDDLDAVVDALEAKGVRREQYDMPGIKTDARGIAAGMPGHRMAWIKDTEGNILGMVGP